MKLESQVFLKNLLAKDVKSNFFDLIASLFFHFHCYQIIDGNIYHNIPLNTFYKL